MPRPRGARGPSAPVLFRTRLVYMYIALLTLLASRASSEGGAEGSAEGGAEGGVFDERDGRRGRGDSSRPGRVHGERDVGVLGGSGVLGGGGSLLVVRSGDRARAGAHNRTSRAGDAALWPRRRLGNTPPETCEQDGVKYIRCRNRANAYSAAWLAPKGTFLKTGYADRLTLEWHSFNIYNQVKGSGYKTEAPTDFYVVHLSAYEHAQANGKTHMLTKSGLTKVTANADTEHEMACGVGNYTFEPRNRVRTRVRVRVRMLSSAAHTPTSPFASRRTLCYSLTHASPVRSLAGDRDRAVLLGRRGK